MHFRKAYLFGATLLPAASGLQAEETVCTGKLTGSHDNVVVPQGAICTITNAQIEGNVLVNPTGALTIGNRTYIDGNVQSEGAAYVRLNGRSVTVGGNLQLKKVTGSSGIERGTVIYGDFQYEENSGYLNARDGFIYGNMQVFKNTGGANITNYTIRQSLQCKENSPPPTGGGNTAGDKEDQCAAL